MDGIWLQLGLVGVLVLINAVFAGSELALVSLRPAQLQRLERGSARGAALARLARDPNRFLATIQIGITLAGFLASASAAVSLTAPLEDWLAFLGNGSEVAAIVVVTLILSYLTLVVGELVPKRLAMQRAERWGLLVARPLSALASATRPVVWLLSRSTDVVVRLVGGTPNGDAEQITHEELRDLVALHTSFSPQQRAIITGAFEISERKLREVLCPRSNVFVIDSRLRCGAALRTLVASGHSRAPVAPAGDLDAVQGAVHLRDLLTDVETRTVAMVARPVPLFPETTSVLVALREMQTRRAQLAVVINEYGATEGIVTIEDLVEELVGEIYDETDLDLSAVRRTSDGTIIVPGHFPIHDLADLDIDVPDGPYTTVAGLLLSELGYIPDEPGDSADIGDWRLTATHIDHRTITEVAFTRVSPRT